MRVGQIIEPTLSMRGGPVQSAFCGPSKRWA